MPAHGEGIRERLIGLGAPVLADALLELASYCDAGEGIIARLTLSSSQNIQRLKSRLNALKSSDDFIDWEEASSFASTLERLLADIKAVVDVPRVGLELVADFFRSDAAIFERCDDSNGTVGDVFIYDASELFAYFASKIDDKAFLADLTLDLGLSDNYGARSKLLDHCASYLPQNVARDMVARLQGLAEREVDSFQRGHVLGLVESLAKQLNDPTLYEKAKLEVHPETNANNCLDIAKVYLSAGQAENALAWLDRISPTDVVRAHARDRLLFEAYGLLDNKEKLTEVAWRQFRGARCPETLDQLLRVIGSEQREIILAEEIQNILADKEFSSVDASFMANLGFSAELEKYILDRAQLLNGDCYASLLPLAEYLGSGKSGLAASVIYRALLESILRRANSTYYHHGVRYLKILDLLAPSIQDWKEFIPHSAYYTEIRKTHGRKSSFWPKYESKT